ncbi:putative ABC transport system substrate-binding protein [Clostridium cavendishii DSM 21758]|uniref:Putative ABC transport system substrate-binding protein n=1 Tax=Clostridium cavendishii DSM 21758 TaxID=1121302 RepID=A0A1M6SKV6_9CLOT|nr:ABC transporter substrate-binding protein [Clostridium cavendishii]SHK45276.1 putative ABC transport system substrate-binding protein [Clostridium cavendishii DSM 21758]
MVAKKKISVLISILLGTAIIAGCSNKSNEGQSTKKTVSIGINQIAEHPALDEAREGFKDALKSNGYEEGKNLTLDFKNAQGDISTAQMISQNFVTEKKDMIFAIGTPAAQSAFNVSKEIPIIVTAITDAKKAGIVENYDKGNTNVAGTSDAAPLDKQFKLLKQIFKDVKKVGIIYNTSEVNSEVQIGKIKEIAKDNNLELVVTGVNTVNDVSTALDVMLSKVDALYTLTDNLVASSMPLISKKAIEKKIPVIGGEEAHVKAGALITEGINYKKLGFEAGLKAVEVLEGKNIKEMSVSTLNDTELVINKNTLDALKIQIPKEILDKAKIVKEGN